MQLIGRDAEMLTHTLYGAFGTLWKIVDGLRTVALRWVGNTSGTWFTKLTKQGLQQLKEPDTVIMESA